MSTYTLNFESQTSVSASEAWNWITSFSGISSEIKPLLNMTAPKGVESIQDIDFKLGEPLFRSTLLLFVAIPVDYSRLTVIEMEEGQWFVEESPMGSMKLWQHERYVVDAPEGAVIRDCTRLSQGLHEQSLHGALKCCFVTGTG